MNIFEFLTLVVAIILGIYQVSRDKRNIRVSCNFAVAASSVEETLGFVVITAVNRGPRPIQIEGAGFLLNNGFTWTQVRNKLGAIQFSNKLEDGEPVKFFFDLEEVEKNIRLAGSSKLRYTKAYVRDAEEKYHTCKLPRGFKERDLS